MTSKPDSNTSPRKPPLRVGAACSRPRQRSCAGTGTSPLSAAAVGEALRLVVPWPSIRSRAVSGLSIKAGPPAMRSTTMSSPGTAVTRTLSVAAPPLRRAATRTESFRRPGRLDGREPLPPLPALSVLPRLAWRWPGMMKVMGVLFWAVAMFLVSSRGSEHQRKARVEQAGICMEAALS